MTTQDFTTTILVDQAPMAVFNAINNVRKWWSEHIDGGTERLNDEFTYRYQNVHICKMKIIESVPGKIVVWQVLENYFNFTKDKTEWTGNKIIFEITEFDGKTQVRFTQHGLVPEYECFDICRNAWGTYIGKSLRNLIATGKGEPNPIEEIVNQAAAKATKLDYHKSISVNVSAHDAFNTINNVAAWWTVMIEGNTQKLNDIFTVTFGETWITLEVTELIPDQKISWRVIDCNKHWLKDKKEWKDTTLIWEVVAENNAIKISITHLGLAPGMECYNGCEKAWDFYVGESMYMLLTKGKGIPELK